MSLAFSLTFEKTRNLKLCLRSLRSLTSVQAQLSLRSGNLTSLNSIGGRARIYFDLSNSKANFSNSDIDNLDKSSFIAFIGIPFTCRA